MVRFGPDEIVRLGHLWWEGVLNLSFSSCFHSSALLHFQFIYAHCMLMFTSTSYSAHEVVHLSLSMECILCEHKEITWKVSPPQPPPFVPNLKLVGKELKNQTPQQTHSHDLCKDTHACLIHSQQMSIHFMHWNSSNSHFWLFLWSFETSNSCQLVALNWCIVSVMSVCHFWNKCVPMASFTVEFFLEWPLQNQKLNFPLWKARNGQAFVHRVQRRQLRLDQVWVCRIFSPMEQMCVHVKSYHSP